MINFESIFKNKLMLNPKISEREKQDLLHLKNEFDKRVSAENHFLIASSGSSRHQNESVKLVALSRLSVLNSAARFNRHFGATKSDNWGLVLPEFHVAGLGVMARAFLTGAQVFHQNWNADEINKWISVNNISFVSMVPAQIFDLVEKNIQCPPEVKKVFVGGGALSPHLYEKIVDLNWPLVETYGMTETASMIAEKHGSEYRLFDGIEIKTEENCLAVHCDSLLSAIIQKIDEEIHFVDYRGEYWYETSDEIEQSSSQTFKFRGRKKEYIKILGEGVSLTELRHLIEDISGRFKINPFSVCLLPIEEARAGHQLILVAEKCLNPNSVDILVEEYHRSCRAYEKIARIIYIDKIPRTDLGKIKTEVLKSSVTEIMEESNKWQL